MGLDKKLFTGVDAAASYHSSLIMNLDPNDSASYSGSGSTITDISGSATTYNGTLSGGSFVSGSPSYFSMDSTNKITTSLDLTQSSGYTISVFVWDNGGTGVVAANRKQIGGTSSADGNGGIFMMGGNITSDISGESVYVYQYDTGGSPKYFVSYTTSGGTGAYNDGAWHLIQLSVSSSSEKLVIDGSEVAWTDNGSLDFVNFRFGGASNDSDNFLPNTVDRIGAMRIYSQALTVSEMQAEHNIDCATYGLATV
jgi:hypothetical protein